MLIFSLFLITVAVGENSENYGESYDRDYESAYSDPLQRLFILIPSFLTVKKSPTLATWRLRVNTALKSIL